MAELTGKYLINPQAVDTDEKAMIARHEANRAKCKKKDGTIPSFHSGEVLRFTAVQIMLDWLGIKEQAARNQIRDLFMTTPGWVAANGSQARQAAEKKETLSVMKDYGDA